MDKLTAGAAEFSWQGFCGAFARVSYFIRFSTTSTTWSTVKPNFSNSFAAGAEAPKDFMLITAPSRPV